VLAHELGVLGVAQALEARGAAEAELDDFGQVFLFGVEGAGGGGS